MFFGLVLLSKSSLFSFTNTEIPSGSIIQRWIDVENGIIDQNLTFLQCKGSCRFELLAYPETNKSDVFKDTAGNQIICCDPNEYKCKEGHVFYNEHNNFTIYKEYNIEGTPVSDSNSKSDKKTKDSLPAHQNVPSGYEMKNGRVVYSFVLANCGKEPFRVTGHVTVRSEKGFADLRLSATKYITAVLALLGIIFAVSWYMSISKRRPRLAIQHYFFIGSSIFYAIAMLFLCILLWVWNATGSTSVLLTLFASIFRAACFTALFYCSIVGLQMPQEINYNGFVAVAVLISISSFVEINGLESITNRSTSRWVFGFGAVPFLDFFVLSIISVVIIVVAIKKAPEETSDDPRRKQLLILFSASYVIYFSLATAITFVTIKSDGVKERSSTELLGFITTPLYLTCLLAVNGKFWFEFNPNGWEAQKFNGTDQSDNGIGLFDDNATEYVGPAQDSLIPDLAVKKSDKKKRSDDGFDIDDEFSGSGDSLEIEDKID